MSNEVTEQEQALMAIKLAENVQKMIRDEVRLALQDYTFMNSIADPYPLSDTVFRNAGGNANFQLAVKSYIQSKLNGY